MLKRLCLVVATVAVAAASVTLLAAPQVTLVLRNGDRLRCELIDLGGVGFTYRSGGAEQTLPANDVALIEFVGGAIPKPELAKMQGGRPFIALRNGDIIDGRLFDVSGANSMRMTVRTPDGNQDFSADDIARIFLARWEGMPQAASTRPTLTPGGDGISIPANPCWTNVDVFVRRGQQVSFNGSGEIQLSDDADDIATVVGAKSGRLAPGAPMPNVLAGALIGRIGNSAPFGIGDQRQALGMPAGGELWLGVNDDHCGDNRGEFRVRITPR